MSTTATLPRHLRDAVTRELAGEAILWVGRPSPFRAFLSTLPIWLFAIPWTVFCVGWEYAALAGWLSGSPAPSGTHGAMAAVFALFGIPFVLVGLGMMAAPLIAWSRARRMVYAVSPRRLVSLTVGRSLAVKSIPLASVVRTERVERRNGHGTLKVVVGTHRDSDGDRVDDKEILWSIPEVRKVEQLVTARAGSASRAA
jgi:hypothetical protein